ncbi:hypothetical protein J1605_022085 [Eschrichtius robustus]|uniref:Uncharacterized protein n=1 Tax=Eschrichtius robustus TaxID=9764 RepID=A0AB34HBJ1_ESCRO|nr:hypothetical protein J1605_022085 [Eschrichtius robustus]
MTVSPEEGGGCAQARLPPQAGRGLSVPLPPPRRVAPAAQGRPGLAGPHPRAAAAPPAGRGGQSGRKEPEPSCHRVRAGGTAAAAAAGVSRALSPPGTPSSPPATLQRPPEPPRRPRTPEAAGPGPPRPSARPPRPAPAFTLERPRQPQQGRRRRIEELSRSSRERLLQSRDRMFSKFTSILQHAVEAVRPRAAGARQVGDGGRPTLPRRPRESPAASARPSASPAPRRGEARGGRRGVVRAPGPRAWLRVDPLLSFLLRAGVEPFPSLTRLAPSLPLQEDFVYHWKAITHYYIETSGKKQC